MDSFSDVGLNMLSTLGKKRFGLGHRIRRAQDHATPRHSGCSVRTRRADHGTRWHRTRASLALALDALDRCQLSQNSSFSFRMVILQTIIRSLRSRAWQERGTVVITIGVGETPQMKSLRTLASGTGGQVHGSKQLWKNLVFERSQLSGGNPALGKGVSSQRDGWACA